MRIFLQVIALLTASQFAVASPSDDLNKLLDDIWQYQLSVSPVFATSEGVHDYDDQLSDISPEGLAKQNRQYQFFLTQLNNIDRKALSRTEQINLMMQLRSVQNQIDQYRFNSHYVPVTS